MIELFQYKVCINFTLMFEVLDIYLKELELVIPDRMY